MRQQLIERPPDLGNLGVRAPLALGDVVLRLLSKDPRDRYQSAEGALADLRFLGEALSRGESEPALAVGTRDRRAVLTEPSFVGRKKQLGFLQAELDRACRGEGGVVLLSGEAGIGKSGLTAKLLGKTAAEPQVRIRYGRAAWSSRTFEIWMFKWPRLVWSLPARLDEAKAAVTPREPWRHTGRLVNMKAQGCYGLDEYRRWLGPLPMNLLTRLKLRALAALPRPLFEVLLRLALLARPRDRATMLFELRRSRAARSG